MTQFVLAIDQGTTSTRAIIFNRAGQIHATAQKEHRQFFPRAGWVEHDPQEIWLNTREVVGLALARGETTPANRSEEHTSELQSRGHLVCRLLLEKKKE